MPYCYLLKCKDGSLYCGSAKNLDARIKQHNLGKGSKYVRSRGGGKLIYKQKLRTWRQALKREAAIKKLSRTQKLALIRTAQSTKQ